MTSDICALNSDCYWLSAARECRANELLASVMKTLKGSDNAWGRFSRVLCLRYHFSCVLTETGMHVFISFSVESNFSAYTESCNAYRISEIYKNHDKWVFTLISAVTNRIFLWGAAVASLFLRAFEELNRFPFLTYKICYSICG